MNLSFSVNKIVVHQLAGSRFADAIYEMSFFMLDVEIFTRFDF
jgi:hypothetical protein